MSRFPIRMLFALLFQACAVTAQHQHAAASEQPVTLLPGLGLWRHPIATRSPEAQKFFDQGLTLVYGFNRYEALRSFRKAAELDPSAAMPYWGIAMALGPYINMDLDPDIRMNASCDAVAAGLRVAPAGSHDHAWLEAARARCPNFADPDPYIHAMRQLAARFPDDPDVQTWYAEALLVRVRWKWYDAHGKPAPGVEEAERVLESVLRRYPNHPGANHFYIHVVESSPVPERGVPSAQRLMGIVPAAGHIVHMPGHIWLALGDYENAVAVNERAAGVDREYFAKTGVKSSYYMYYLHNLQFVLYARAMQGRLAQTRDAAARILEAAAAVREMMPEMADIFEMLIAMSNMRLYCWDDILAAKNHAITPLGAAFWHYARALAFASKRQFDAARPEQAEFEKTRKTLNRDSPWDTNKLGDVMDVASAVLDARMQPAPAAAVPKWRRAVELQDALVYGEPPAWYYPVRESLGAALLMGGDAPAAEAVFREGLRQSPNNGRMLFGLRESLAAQKKEAAREWVGREFESAWKGAGIELRIPSL